MLCSVVKHAGSGRARKKCRGKHETKSSVFPHFTSSVFPPSLLYRFLSALEQNRAQSRLLYFFFIFLFFYFFLTLFIYLLQYSTVQYNTLLTILHYISLAANYIQYLGYLPYFPYIISLFPSFFFCFFFV